MGTEFQYAINPLAKNRKNISFSISELDDWDYFKRQKGNKQKTTVLISFEDSMDKFLERDNIEFIKKAMVTHENIFKHQVRELHRVYNMQKTLMDETRNEIKHKANNARHIGHAENCVPMTKGLDLKGFVSDEKGQLGVQTSPSAKLSVWGSSNISAMIPITKGFDLKGSVTDEKGQLSVQSSRNAKLSGWGGSDIPATTRVDGEEKVHLLSQRLCISMENNSNKCEYEECDIDLTLGIGSKKKMKTEGGSSSSSNHNQSNLPHWLYKSLGSNKT